MTFKERVNRLDVRNVRPVSIKFHNKVGQAILDNNDLLFLRTVKQARTVKAPGELIKPLK